MIYEHKVYKPINKISKKKRKEIEDEKPIREALAKRANGRCEWCGRPEWQCLGGLHPHEKVYRSKGIIGRLSLDNSVMVCNTCHGNRGHNLRIIEHF
jgi:5-methylcytosine-specific restriction endonuclease McrA